MFKWDQSAGKMFDRAGLLIATGYSGAGKGVNNPSADGERGVGPVPKGLWSIVRMYNSPNTGPYTLELAPTNGTYTHGRSAFRIHGDNKAMNQTASHGCIILSRAARERIWRSGDRDLMVVE